MTILAKSRVRFFKIKKEIEKDSIILFIVTIVPYIVILLYSLAFFHCSFFSLFITCPVFLYLSISLSKYSAILVSMRNSVLDPDSQYRWTQVHFLDPF